MDEMIKEFLQYGVLGIVALVVGYKYMTNMEQTKEDSKEELREARQMYKQELENDRSMYKQELEKDREVYLTSINSVVGRINVLESDVKEIKNIVKGGIN